MEKIGRSPSIQEFSFRAQTLVVRRSKPGLLRVSSHHGLHDLGIRPHWVFTVQSPVVAQHRADLIQGNSRLWVRRWRRLLGNKDPGSNHHRLVCRKGIYLRFRGVTGRDTGSRRPASWRDDRGWRPVDRSSAAVLLRIWAGCLIVRRSAGSCRRRSVFVRARGSPRKEHHRYSRQRHCHEYWHPRLHDEGDSSTGKMNFNSSLFIGNGELAEASTRRNCAR